MFVIHTNSHDSANSHLPIRSRAKPLWDEPLCHCQAKATDFPLEKGFIDLNRFASIALTIYFNGNKNWNSTEK